MKDKLRIALMVLLVAALLAMAGGFWMFVGVQAEKEKAIEEAEVAEQIAEDEGGIEAMYIALGADGEDYVFADQSGLFTASIPEDALYNENGRKISREELFTGDMMKLYGEILAAESEPPQYSGIERMVRVSKGSVEDAKAYSNKIQQYFGKPICAKERNSKSLLDAEEE